MQNFTILRSHLRDKITTCAILVLAKKEMGLEDAIEVGDKECQKRVLRNSSVKYSRWTGMKMIALVMVLTIAILQAMFSGQVERLSELYLSESTKINSHDCSPSGRNVGGIGQSFQKKSNVILVTGVAGFIGMHTALHLCEMGYEVVGLDLLNDQYYTSDMKVKRLSVLDDGKNNFHFVKGDVCNRSLVNETLTSYGADIVLHLAAQSYERLDGTVSRPFKYPLDNEDCMVDLLELAKHNEKLRLVYASSSSSYLYERTVYTNESARSTRTSYRIDDLTTSMPEDGTLRPNEMLASVYHSLYNVSSLGVRIPAVFGMWGRPDMAYFMWMRDRLFNKVGDYGDWNSTSAGEDYMEVQDAVKSMVELVLDHEKYNNSSKVVSIFERSSNNCHFSNQDLFEAILQPRNQESEQWDLCRSSLSQRVENMIDWFERENATRFMNDDSLISTREHFNYDGRHKNICFVSSMFSIDVQHCDAIRDISSYRNSGDHIKHYFFTNLEELETPGWDKIIIKNLPFRRMITQSRWPKFMGWLHPTIKKNCHSIIYSDANIPPKDLPLERWATLADRAKESASGLLQRPNTRVNSFNKMSVLEELDRLLKNRKDIPQNVYATREWFLAQPDFNDHAKGYWNMILIYHPSNENFRRLMTSFWAQYSNEETSWRDQPLYRYLVDKLDITPETNDKLRKYFHSKAGKNANGHKYSAKDDSNAKLIA